jgi:hypothetical protein
LIQRLQQPQKKDQLIVFKDKNLPLYNWSNLETDKELFKVVGTVIDLGNSIPPDFSGLTWPGVNQSYLKI